MTVRKLAVLKFQGDVERGFQVALEIRWGANQTEHHPVEKIGELPPPTDLMQAYQNWQTTYRSLGRASRVLKPKRIELTSFKQRKEACSAAGRALRQDLNQWLRAESFLPIRETWLKHIASGDQVSVAIRSQTLEIWQLPWQEWDFWQDYRQFEVTFSPLEREEPAIPQLPLPQVLKILVVLGDSTGIDIEADRRSFEQLGAQAEFLTQPKRQELIDHLQHHAYNFLCFAGHSRTEDGLGYIDLNAADSLSLEELRSTLKLAIQNGLRLAIFNSCDGLGLVKALESLPISYLIVMREPVPDQVAQIFLKKFLQVFSGGTEFQFVAEKARQELKKYEDDFPYASWLPLIWQSPSAQYLQERATVSAPVTQPVNHQRSQLHRCRSIWRSLKVPIGIGLACGAVAIGLRLSGGLQPAELAAFDQMMRLRPDEGMDRNLLIIEITDDDIAMQKQNGEQMQYTTVQGESLEYSLSNQSLTRLLKVLEQYQPRVIGLDIYRDVQIDPAFSDLKKQFETLPLAAICQTENPNDPQSFTIDPPPDVPINKVGFSNFFLDDDQVLRRQILGLVPRDLQHTSCQTNQSFSVQVAFKYLNQPQIDSDEGNYDDLHLAGKTYPALRPHAGSYQRIPQDWGGNQILLNYRASQKLAERYTLAEMLKQPNPSNIRDKIVLVGVTAKDKDQHVTPYGQVSGVEIHAHMISQLVNAAQKGRPLMQFWSKPQEILWIGGWAMMGGIIAWSWTRMAKMRRGQAWLLRIGTIGIGTGALGSICARLLVMGYWVPFVPALLAGFLTGSAVYLYYFYLRQRSNRSLL